MRASRTIDELETCWNDFLHAIDRVWHKAEQSHKGNKRWAGWVGGYTSDRKTDPVLTYLRHARNADQHTIEDITSKQLGAYTLTAASSGPAVIHGFKVFADGSVSVDGIGEVQLSFSPGRVKMLPVQDRGCTYAPPPCSLLQAAERGLKYYADFVDVIEYEFG
jgi:hypothetical protein